MSSRRLGLAGFALCCGLLTGCSALAGQPPAASATPGPTETPAIPTATATPEPLAALVNGEPITLARFEREAERFAQAQAELGIELATQPDWQLQLLDLLIERRLLAQGAQASGYQIDAAQVDQRLAEIAEARGGEQAMGAWLAANRYTLEDFKADLAEEMLAELKIASIVDKLPEAVPQVHARHILVATREEAQTLLDQLQAGEDFAALARAYSLDLSTRPAGGDLGWFAQGLLTSPLVEAAAFALADGELSEIVESELGFHIVQPLERQDRPLFGAARTRYRQAAVREWLDSARSRSQIEILVEL